MGKYVRRIWHPTAAELGISRRDRQVWAYEPYIPDVLSNRPFVFEGDVAADVADAERAVVELDANAGALTDTGGLARLLLRAESVASSYIEGLEVSAQRLLRTSLDVVEQRPAHDVRAVEILANVDAMVYAVESAGSITIERLVGVHRRLLAPTKDVRIAGVLRTEQNWIGGTSDSPLRATFVPPPPEEVERLLHDLCAFCEDDGLPAIAQAAIAHAQFETIHPFADGNGRTGRALIAMVLRRRGLTRNITPPISLILATRSNDYVAHLDATRRDGSPTSPATRAALNAWIAFFASACSRAVDDAEQFETRVRALRAEWRTALAGYRSDSTVHAVAALLPSMPVISVRAAEKATGRSFKAANDAVAALIDAGVIVPSSRGRRNRTFEARSLIDAFMNLECRLASPAGDTRVAKPVRHVPYRPEQ